MKRFCTESFALGMLTGAGVLVAAAWLARRIPQGLPACEDRPCPDLLPDDAPDLYPPSDG